MARIPADGMPPSYQDTEMGVDLANIRMENVQWGIIQKLTDSQPLIEITTYLQPLPVSRQRRLQQSFRNSPEDDEQQP